MPKNSLLDTIQKLNTSTKATNIDTYGITKDPTDVIDDNLDDYLSKIRMDVSKGDKKVLNSKITRYKISSNTQKESKKNLYDIIKDQNTLNKLQTMVGNDNAKFAQTLKDYEMIKRMIPQVHRIVMTLKNNILAPEGIVDDIIGIQYPVNIDPDTKAKIEKIVDKYDLNTRIQEWTMNYLIASVSYVSVVPFADIPNMLDEMRDGDKSKGEQYNVVSSILSESIAFEESRKLATLKDLTPRSNIILESSIDLRARHVEDDEVSEIDSSFIITQDELNDAIDWIAENTDITNGGAEYFHRAILNEASARAAQMTEDEKSLNTIMTHLKKSTDPNKNAKAPKKGISKYASNDMTTEGMVSKADSEKIRKLVDFKGCAIEDMDSSKIIEFKIRGTLIGYFYVEDSYDNKKYTNRMSSVMDKLNSSVYVKNTDAEKAKKTEAAITREIADKMMKSINVKFLNDNQDDMRVIYEFIKDNLLYTSTRKHVTFFHPNDLYCFKRSDGSIMKNAMFLAKLYILTLLANVIANVTRGSDRQFYKVKTGLTSDIEGAVNNTIRAIKQNQIRYSDIGTINEIFNLVGSMVDVFMPVSVDGDEPISVETISGQNINMQSEFMEWLIRSIIQSFGVSPSTVDDNNVEFAKTLTMQNIDLAKAVIDAQKEILGPLNKIFQSIVAYELPEYTDFEKITVKLNPPTTIITQMLSDKMNAMAGIADTIASLYFDQTSDDPSNAERARLFKLEYLKKNIPGMDWASIEEIVNDTKLTYESEQKKKNIAPSNDMNGDMGGDMGQYDDSQYQ